MIATKILLMVLGTYIGGWGIRELIKQSFSTVDVHWIIFVMAQLAGAVLGFFVGAELAQLLPQISPS